MYFLRYRCRPWLMASCMISLNVTLGTLCCSDQTSLSRAFSQPADIKDLNVNLFELHRSVQQPRDHPHRPAPAASDIVSELASDPQPGITARSSPAALSTALCIPPFPFALLHDCRASCLRELQLSLPDPYASQKDTTKLAKKSLVVTASSCSLPMAALSHRPSRLWVCARQ
jgi:hypothetical protein